MTDEDNTISLSGFITWIRTWIYTKAEINALLSNISGGVSDYRNYTIVPSDYNPEIDDYISVTVTVTDMTGNPVANEETSLYIKFPSVASEIRYYDDTDNNGQISISNIQMTDWGLIDFRVGSEHCQVHVDGYREVANYSNGFYKLEVNEQTRQCRLTHNSTSNNQNVGSGERFVREGFIPSTYLPRGEFVIPFSRAFTVYLQASTLGTVKIWNSTSTTIKISDKVEIDWSF